MDFEKLTDRARGFLQAAQTIAVREHHQRIAPAHLLKALLDDEQGMAAGLIQAAGGDAKAAKREVDQLVAKVPAVTGSGATQAPALDGDTILRSVHKTGRLLVVDEAFAPFGLGAEVAARVIDAGFDDLDAPIRRLNGASAPTQYSPTLEAAVVPSVEEIVRALRELAAE